MSIIIGLIAPAQSGKTLLANTIAELASAECEVRGFAYPIKDGLRRMGITKESTPSLYRKCAQTVGEAARDAHPDHWVNAFEVGAIRDDLLDADAMLVIDDVRYANEVEWIREQGRLGHTTLLVFVDRDIDMDEPFRAHESERLSNSLWHDYHGVGHQIGSRNDHEEYPLWLALDSTWGPLWVAPNRGTFSIEALARAIIVEAHRA